MALRLSSWSAARRGVSISLSVPAWASAAGSVPCLMPTWEMVRGYKAGRLSQDDYVHQYRDLLAERWADVEAWLASLDADQDVTLCCWEEAGHFCHRQLVALLVNRHRPDIDVILE
jgi:hypothetical protein